MKIIFKYVAGVLFLLSSIGAIQYSGIIGAIPFFLGALICIPTTLAFIENSIIHYTFKSWQKYAIVILLFFIGGKFLPESEITQSSSKIVAPITDTSIIKEEVKPDVAKWEYSEEVDKMTSKKIKFASIIANNLLQFDFPYDGGSLASIFLRKKDNKTDIFLTVSKGQFHGGINGGYFRARFDDAPPKKYSFSEPSDGSSDMIFLSPENEIISKMKKSKKLIIEVEFYDNGSKQIEFDVDGLQW